jgi:hypothetical protein
VLKPIWNALGDIRLAVILLLTASATLLTGTFYAEDHFSLFMALNHMRIQDWLPAQWASRPELVWWIPVLFAIMALLGINTFACAANRFLRLIGQRRNMAAGRFFYLLTPSLVHFLFITIMLGHLATFTAGRWQRLPLAADSPIAVSPEAPAYRVAAIRDEFYPESSALGGRLRQTAVALEGAGGEALQLQYGWPVFIDGRFLLIDKAPQGEKAQKKSMPAGSPPDRRPGPASAEAREASVGRPLLMIVSDPGLAVIILGLTLIMALMIGYFLFKSKSAKWIAAVAVLVLLGAHPAAAPAAESRPEELAQIAARIEKLSPDPAFKDDRYGLILIYITPDEKGSMVSRMDRLPPFWQDRARDCDYRLAVCSPAVRQLARDLFDFSIRTRDKKKEETK